jgi:hypothetical protein
VRVFVSLILVPDGELRSGVPDLAHSPTIKTQSTGHHLLWPTVPLHRFLQEFQR